MTLNFLPRLPGAIGWKPYLDDARGFHRTALGGAGRPGVFTPEIRYNLIAMAIEKYLMALMIHVRSLPDNHTMADLLAALRRIAPVDQDLAHELEFIDSFQEICSVEGYHRVAPTQVDIQRMLATCDRIRDLVLSRLPESEDRPLPRS